MSLRFPDYLELKLKKYFEYLELHSWFIVFFFFLLSLILRIWLLPFLEILRDDAFLYVIKGLEVSQGNFTPVINSSIGWPFLLGILFYFVKGSSIVNYMFYSQVLSSIIAAGVVFPLYLIAKKYLTWPYILLLFFFFLIEPHFLFSSIYGLSEPLFILIFLFVIYFIIKSEEDIRFIYLASLFASLAYYVRLNGVILLLIVFGGYLLIHYKNLKFRDLLFIALIFMLVSLPNLYSRYSEFGSATYAGENSKYFISNPKYLWSDNIKAPSLFEYLNGTSLYDIYDKFIYHGLFSVVYAALYKVINPILLFFFLLACFNCILHKKWYIFLMVIFIWGLSIVPIYHIYHSYRYLFPLIPIFLFLSSKGISISFDHLKFKYVIIFLFLLVSSFVIGFTVYNNVQDLPTITTEQNIKSASWIADNVKGKIATMKDLDLILLSLNTLDIKISNEATSFALYSQSKNLTLIKPPYFDTLAEALPYFKQIGVTHIIIDSSNFERRPYFSEIENGNYPFLKEIYSNYNSEKAKSKIKIFEIDWSKFN